MPNPPPDSSPRRRRHRSAQRERILDWLRETDVHPTAAQIHEGLAAPPRRASTGSASASKKSLGASPRRGRSATVRSPQLSLGTVYRNLEVLVAEGDVREVLVAGRPARYDARIDPHHHFCCDACGRITDVDLPVPRSLARRLADEHGLSAERIHVSFHGLCPQCEREASRTRRGSSSKR